MNLKVNLHLPVSQVTSHRVPDCTVLALEVAGQSDVVIRDHRAPQEIPVGNGGTQPCKIGYSNVNFSIYKPAGQPCCYNYIVWGFG